MISPLSQSEERGAVAVTAALVILSIIITSFIIWYPRWVEVRRKGAESNLMDGVMQSFEQVKDEIKNLPTGEVLSIPFRLGTKTGFLAPEAGEGGRLSIEPTPPENAWTQYDWSGGETQPILEVGKWSDDYENYYRGENENAGSIRLVGGVRPAPENLYENFTSVVNGAPLVLITLYFLIWVIFTLLWRTDTRTSGLGFHHVACGETPFS